MSAVLHHTEGSEAYDLIDRFLRNNLDDTDYAEYSKALDSVLASHAGEPVAYANPVILLPDEDGEEWTAKVQGNCDDVFSLPLYANHLAPNQGEAA